jgi:hypothetical protein
VKVADLYMQQWDQQLGTRIASWKARLLPLLEIQVCDVSNLTGVTGVSLLLLLHLYSR